MKRLTKLIVLGSAVAGVFGLLRRARAHSSIATDAATRFDANAPRDIVGSNIEEAVLIATESFQRSTP